MSYPDDRALHDEAVRRLEAQRARLDFKNRPVVLTAEQLAAVHRYLAEKWEINDDPPDPERKMG